MSKRLLRDQGGFSIVELIIAVVILSVGLLSMAGTSGFVAKRVRVANMRTERSAALHYGIERLRATPFNDMASLPQNSADTVGLFTVWWDVAVVSDHLRDVSVYTAGPDVDVGTANWATARDTFSFRIARP